MWCDVNKSGNRLHIYASKVKEYHLQFMSSLAGMKINIGNISHPPTSYFLNSGDPDVSRNSTVYMKMARSTHSASELSIYTLLHRCLSVV
jgi:hypothetical protein